MDLSATKKEKRLLIGACGSISVLNLHQWLAYLRTTLFEQTRVILTKSAADFVNPQMISSFTGTPTYLDMMSDPEFPAPHVSLTRWADLLLVLPASANIIGKAANGIGDDLLSSAILAANIPIVFVPSMNWEMWNKPSVQRNVAQLEADGHHILLPKRGPGYKMATGTAEDGMEIDMSHVAVKVMRLLNSRG